MQYLTHFEPKRSLKTYYIYLTLALVPLALKVPNVFIFLVIMLFLYRLGFHFGIKILRMYEFITYVDKKIIDSLKISINQSLDVNLLFVVAMAVMSFFPEMIGLVLITQSAFGICENLTLILFFYLVFKLIKTKYH